MNKSKKKAKKRVANISAFSRKIHAREYLAFAVATSASAKLINTLLKNGIEVLQVRKRARETHVIIPLIFETEFKRVCEELCYDYSLSKTFGIKEKILHFILRPCLVVGALIGIALISFFSSFIFSYSIQGNNNVSYAEIRNVLAQNGVNNFTYKPRINLVKIQREIAGLNGISFASVSLKGNRLYVSVKEELKRQLPEVINTAPITATRSAVISKIVVESGSACVKVGDKVQVGDKLIDNNYTFTEGGAPSEAKGEVYGLVVYQKEVRLFANTIERVRTGRTAISRAVYFGGKEILKAKHSPYVDYDVETHFVQNVYGALQVVEYKYYEVKNQNVFHDVEVDSAKAIAKAQSELLAEIPFYAEVVRSASHQKKMDNDIQIVIYYEIKQRIDSLFDFS